MLVTLPENRLFDVQKYMCRKRDKQCNGYVNDFNQFVDLQVRTYIDLKRYSPCINNFSMQA
jgi:hypothetical protein